MLPLTRRAFVKTSIDGAAVLAAGAAVLECPRAVVAQSAQDKVVLGLIGAGGRGRHVAKLLVQVGNVEFKYACDVEEARGAAAAAELSQLQGSACQTVPDLRTVLDDKDVDAVLVATPEQWHALATIWACQANKDVFVEKNISLTIWEGRKMIEAARKYNRVVQCGLQCRSAPYVAAARQYIAGGGLGDVYLVKVYGMLPFTYGGYPQPQEPDSVPPPGLDWDKWLGPAPARPYNKQVHRQWYGFWDFSGGNTSDAIHTLDLARLAVGDPGHPKTVNCVGGRWQYADRGEMPDVQIVTYEYERLVMTYENTGFTPYMFKTPDHIRNGDLFPFWPQNSDRIEIYGTKRMMYLGRHGAGWQVFGEGPQELGSTFGNVVDQHYGRVADPPHVANFVDCIRTRQRPAADIEVCHYSACLEHLANLAYRLGNQKLCFDGNNETFVGNSDANGRLKPAYREPYRVPEKV